MVVQMGARRSYEVARMFSNHGLLHSLHTDYAIHEGQKTGRKGFVSKLARGAAARRLVRGIPEERLRSHLFPNVFGKVCRLLHLPKQLIYELEDFILGLSLLRSVKTFPEVLLSLAGNGGPLLFQVAKKQGVTIVSDVVIVPDALRVEREERRKWPRWKEEGSVSSLDIAVYERRLRRLIAASDMLICPSRAVATRITEFSARTSPRIEIIPYAFGDDPGLDQPIPGRVLFTGSAVLRKGLPYLALAAEELRRRGRLYQIRIAGDISKSIRNLPECKDLIFLGKLDRTRLVLELSSADIFCLPSLAEGMARACLEAMSHGKPLVATEASGAPIEHGVEGLIVPECDPVAIADAIETLIEDRDMRDKMSRAARVRCASLEPDLIARALISAIYKEGITA